MKQRLLTFISALFILLLASNCAGIKPFFQAGNVPALTPPRSTNMTQANRHIDNFGYVPSPAEENGIFDMNKRQYRLSASLPASVKFEF
jgi:hypothetical protein